MATGRRPKPHATGRLPAGDLTQRLGVEQISARGVNVPELIETLIDAAGAEFTTYYYYTILRIHLAGHEDYKEICEDARLEDRAHFELITARIYELGGNTPSDIRDFADRAGCPDAYLPSVCEVGWDIACACRVLEGEWDNADARRHFRQDREAGFIPATRGGRSRS